MSRKRITQALVDSLLAKVPDVVEENVWDNLLPGFGIRRGRSWQAMRRIGGRSVRMHGLPTLREEPSVKVTRSRVSKWLADPDVKDEPAKTTEPLTVHRLIERYLRERPKVNGDDRPLAPEYLNEIARCLAFDVSSKIGHMQVSTVTSKTIKGLINGIAKPKHARHVLAYVRKMFNWAVEQEIVERSPAAGIKPPAGSKSVRDRALETDDELRWFWHACDQIGWPFGPLFQLLLLLACRRDELACATLSEFDGDMWKLTRTKNGRPHLTHLTPLAHQILDALPRIKSTRNDPYVFSTNGNTAISGFSHAMAAVRKRIAILAEQDGKKPPGDFTVHDLRRSAATGMAALRIPPHVVDKILNHSTGKISGVARIYNRFEYLEERQEALNLWSERIVKLTDGPRSADVIDLSRHLA